MPLKDNPPEYHQPAIGSFGGVNMVPGLEVDGGLVEML
jgi:hypothetical protein